MNDFFATPIGDGLGLVPLTKSDSIWDLKL